MMSMASLILLVLFVVLAALVAIVIFTVRRLRKNAAAAGYPGVFAHLRAVPRNDEEKRQAVDLAMKGAVLCVVGLFFPPMILIGVIPFYYGSRKLIMVWLGLDLLADDGDLSSA
jgi:hypothetical protein